MRPPLFSFDRRLTLVPPAAIPHRQRGILQLKFKVTSDARSPPVPAQLILRKAADYKGQNRGPLHRPTLPLPKSLLNHRQRPRRNSELREFRPRHPLHPAHVVRRAQAPAYHPALVVDQHVVILRLAGGVANDPLEDLNNSQRFHLQAGLLAHLAYDAGFQRFARLQDSARQRPVAFQRLVAPLDQQDLVALENQSSDSQDGARRVTPVIRSPIAAAAPRIAAQYGMAPFTSRRTR